MNMGTIAGFSLLAAGGTAGFIGVLRYSDFLARLHIVNNTIPDKWAMGWDAGENFPRNAAVCMSFWRQEYLAIPDKELHMLGNSVRSSLIVGVILVIVGIIILTANDFLAK
jgi:hypothetical protein